MTTASQEDTAKKDPSITNSISQKTSRRPTRALVGERDSGDIKMGRVVSSDRSDLPYEQPFHL
jgi:hypothetical protein